MHVLRHDSPLGFWEQAHPPLPAELRGSVLRITGWCERMPAPLERRELPGTAVVLIVPLDRNLQVALDEREPRTVGPFVGAMHPGPARTRTGGVSDGVQIDLTPFAAQRILGLSMAELAGDVFALGD